MLICEDGEQKVSRSVLENYSDWFSEQLKARKRFGNRFEFRYDKNEAKFSIQCIRNFLDLIHGLQKELSVPEILELVKFIQFEGKNG